MDPHHARRASTNHLMSPSFNHQGPPTHTHRGPSFSAAPGPAPGPGHLNLHLHHPPARFAPTDFFASLSYPRYTSDLLSALRLASLGIYVEPGPCRLFWTEGRLPPLLGAGGEDQFANDVLRACTMIECSVPWEVRSWKGWTKALDAAGQKNIQERETPELRVVLRRPDEVLRVTCAAVKALKG